MPLQPAPGDVHVDRALTDLSLRFSQTQDMFVSAQVFPRVPVQHRSDKYFTYDRSYWFRTDAQLRAPGTESAGSGYAIGTDDYSIDVFALHKDVDDQTRANAESPIRLDSDATEFVTQHLMQKREQDWVSTYFTTGIWATDTVGGTDFTQWDDDASDPIGVMTDAVTTVAKNTAQKPNTLVLGAEVWQDLKNHPDYLERIKYTQGPAVVGQQLLAQLIEVDRVFVAWSVKNTGAEGETASYDFNFGKNALLMYVAPNAGLNTPSAGYTFTWSGLMGATQDGVRIKRFRQEHLASDRIEGEMAYDHKVVSADLGYFFSGAVS